MKHKLILPLTKSPHSAGRIGAKEKQDWYRGLEKAVNILHENLGKILILSDVQVGGKDHECDIYSRELRRLVGDGFEKYLVVVKHGQETMEQLDFAAQYAEMHNMDLEIISTFLHYLRVRWLTRGMGFTHHVVFGIPRPKEAITDILLTFLFPIIDVVGLRKKFLEKVIKRRMGGIH